MDFDSIFTTYIAGFIVNIAAGIFLYFPLKSLLDWLPSEASLHERFREVRTKANANDKITALTPLLFISFYWLFVGEMLWVFLTVVIELLNWPDITWQFLSDGNTLKQFIQRRSPGIVWGRSLLYIIGGLYIAGCFRQGIRIAKQCWDVYKTIDNRNA